MIDNVDSRSGGDPFTGVYCSIYPVRFTSNTRLTYL